MTSSSSRPAPGGAHPDPFSDDSALPADPPPAYTPQAGSNGPEQVLAAGPSRMDFGGPPPVPDRLANGHGWNQGYAGGHNPHHMSPPSSAQPSWSPPSHPPPHLSAQHTSSTSSLPPPPRRVPSSASSGPLTGQSTGEGDVTPTEVATPGRPLLRDGKFLIYPIGHLCKKCYNMGYKNNDPGHPCKTCWSKYGKPYTSAIAHSWPRPSSTASTSQATNYQRPLPSFRPPQHAPPPPAHQGYPGAHMGHMRNDYPHPPPQPHPPGGYPMGPPPPHIVHGPGPMMAPHYGWGPPPGAIVVQPGDPRIGGMICQRCYGQGTVPAFFGFDDEQCWACRGVGRVF